MIFEGLSERLQATFKKLRGHGKLTEKEVNEAMRDVRMALLEADVNFKVVKDFINKVKERAVGQNILDTLTPAQAVIKIVDEELTAKPPQYLSDSTYRHHDGGAARGRKDHHSGEISSQLEKTREASSFGSG